MNYTSKELAGGEESFYIQRNVCTDSVLLKYSLEKIKDLRLHNFSDVGLIVSNHWNSE